MRYSRAHILVLSILLEGALACVYLIWAKYRGVFGWTPPTLEHLVVGVLACFPLFALNFLLFGPLSHRVKMLRTCFEFKERVVKPLADQLTFTDSFVVACSAGIGEELFFRGVLQIELGIIIASVLFSVLHFGPSVGNFVLIACLYAVIGAYFGLLYRYTGTLWVPVLTHAIYDYLALLYMRYWYKSPAACVAGYYGAPK